GREHPHVPDPPAARGAVPGRSGGTGGAGRRPGRRAVATDPGTRRDVPGPARRPVRVRGVRRGRGGRTGVRVRPAQPARRRTPHRRAMTFAEAVDAVRSGTDPDAAAGALLEQMTDAERLGLLDGDEPFWPGMPDMMGKGYNLEPIVAGAVPRLGIPGIRFSDGPRGAVIGRSTAFPVPMARGATWDPDLEAQVGAAIGAEIRAQGGNLFGGVCVNLLRHPAWGRAQETYGEEPVLLGAMGAGLTRGVQRHVMATVKHYACNSMENARFTVDVHIDERALHEVYLPH